MKRPAGVTVLAVVNLLEAVLLLLVAAMLVVLVWLARQGGLASAGVEVPAASAQLLRWLLRRGETGGLAPILAGCVLVAGIYLALGAGLWKLRNWARRGTLVLATVRLLLLLAALAHSLPELDAASAALQGLMLVVYIWIVWYLLQPRAKQAFGAG